MGKSRSGPDHKNNSNRIEVFAKRAKRKKKGQINQSQSREDLRDSAASFSISACPRQRLRTNFLLLLLLLLLLFLRRTRSIK